MVAIDEEIMERISDGNQELYDDIYDGFREFLEKRAGKKNEGYYQENIHVSGLYDCKRKVVMSYYGFEKNPQDLAELLMFEIANFIHDLMAKWARQSKTFRLLGAEKVLSDFLPDMIAGKCDLILKHRKTGLIILTDTKTTHPNNFERYFDKLLKSSHVFQVNTYAMGIKNKGIKVDKKIMTYFDRGGSHNPVFIGVGDLPEETIHARIDGYVEAVKRYAQDKTLPVLHPLQFSTDKYNRVSARRPWNCDYCKYCGVSCGSYGDNFPSKERKVIGELVLGRLEVAPEYVSIADKLRQQYAQRQEEGED